jgi:hypothetical protein
MTSIPTAAVPRQRTRPPAPADQPPSPVPPPRATPPGTDPTAPARATRPAADPDPPTPADRPPPAAPPARAAPAAAAPGTDPPESAPVRAGEPRAGAPPARVATIRRMPTPGPAAHRPGPRFTVPGYPADQRRHRPAPADGTEPGDPGSTGGRREPPVQAERVLRMVLEVRAGRRPLAQLNGLVTARVLRYVAAEANRPAARDRGPGRAVVVGAGPALRAVRVCRPTDHAAEVSAVWRDRGRYRALAARFERQPAGRPDDPEAGRYAWRCTVLRLG